MMIGLGTIINTAAIIIASCRQDISLLISEIERLRKILDENEIDY